MTQPMSVPPQYSLQQLQEYINLTRHFTGTDPKEIAVSRECVDWYQAQVKQVAKNLNIPTTKNHKEPMYMGVKLVTK